MNIFLTILFILLSPFVIAIIFYIAGYFWKSGEIDAMEKKLKSK